MGYPKYTERTPPKPTVSSSDAVTYSSHHIMNIQDFLDQFKVIRLAKGECITSYDVKALYTLVPVHPDISIMRHRLEQNMQLHLRTLLEYCLKRPISHSKVSIINRYVGQPWGLLLVPLWPTCSWKILKSRPSTQLPIHPGCGLSMWITPLSSKGQNTATNLHVNSID